MSMVNEPNFEKLVRFTSKLAIIPIREKAGGFDILKPSAPGTSCNSTQYQPHNS